MERGPEGAELGRGWLARTLPGAQPRDALWLALMSLSLFVLLLPFASYVAVLPFVKEEWGLNNTGAGSVYSAYLAGYAFSALLVIPLTDRFGPRYIFLGSSVISVVAHVLFALLATDALSAVVLRAVAGVGLVGVYMPGLRVIAERFTRHGRGTAMGLFVTAFYGANSVSLALTGLLLDRLPWREAYLLVSVAAALSLPLSYLLLRGSRRAVVRAASGRLDLTVLANRRVRYLILGYSLHAAELYVIRVWLPAFLLAVLVAKGYGTAQAAVLAAGVGGAALAAGALGPVVGGWLSDRLGRVPSASVIFAVSGACSWGIGWMMGLSWWAVVAVSVLYGWATAADSAIYSTAITEAAEPSRQGSTMALQSFLGFMGGVVGPILFGAVLDLSPEGLQWGLGFSAVGALAVIAVFGLSRISSVKRAGPAGVEARSARRP